jgi:uncharacterized protein with PIN domain
MSVPCPRCGRDYDVTLFAFGRTIHCTCGSRVALEPRVRSVGAETPPRFVADAMLGRLARWLRMLGFDVVWDAGISDAEIARRAFEEDRVVLTRDRSLPQEWRVPRVLVLGSDALREQLREVAADFALAAHERPFTRCTRCNEPLDEAPPESVAAEVPPRVLREQTRFARCRGCGRVYWEGSHVERIRRALDEIVRS